MNISPSSGLRPPSPTKNSEEKAEPNPPSPRVRRVGEGARRAGEGGRKTVKPGHRQIFQPHNFPERVQLRARSISTET